MTLLGRADYAKYTVLLRVAIPLQFSVFYVQQSQSEMVELVSELQKIIDVQEDDIRLYPIQHFDIEMWDKSGISAVNKTMLLL